MEVLFEATTSADLNVVAVGIADKARGCANLLKGLRDFSVGSHLPTRHADIPPGGNTKLLELHSDLFDLGRVHGQGTVAHNQVLVSVHCRLALCNDETFNFLK